MPRTISYVGAPVEVSDYEDQHRYCNQKNVIDEIPINPILRADFDCTPNEDRESLELKDWWNKPYIVTSTWDDFADTWERYLKRCQDNNVPPTGIDEFNTTQADRKENWIASWPTGTRYSVRCLDGGAWDRSTGWAMCASLDEALRFAKDTTPFYASQVSLGQE